GCADVGGPRGVRRRVLPAGGRGRGTAPTAAGGSRDVRADGVRVSGVHTHERRGYRLRPPRPGGGGGRRLRGPRPTGRGARDRGGALGIALFGSIGLAIYRGLLAASFPPGMPADVTQQALATLGGAVVAARQLPVDVGGALVDAARAAFVRGLVVSELISGVGTLGLAVFAWVAVRGAGLAGP